MADNFFSDVQQSWAPSARPGFELRLQRDEMGRMVVVASTGSDARDGWQGVKHL